jgi:hypothetical protein
MQEIYLLSRKQLGHKKSPPILDFKKKTPNSTATTNFRFLKKTPYSTATTNLGMTYFVCWPQQFS